MTENDSDKKTEKKQFLHLGFFGFDSLFNCLKMKNIYINVYDAKWLLFNGILAKYVDTRANWHEIVEN